MRIGWVGTGVVFLLASCSSVTRNALPADLVEQAAVPGFPDQRAWIFEADRTFQQRLTEGLRMRRETHGSDAPLDLSVLCLSGGGDAGAFGAGLLAGWSDACTRPQFQIVTGISTGALMAPFAFLGSAYDDDIARCYTGVTADQILEPLSLIGMLTMDAAADSAPLAKLLEELVDDSLLDAVAAEDRAGRRLYVGTTNLDSQRFLVWDLGAIAASDHPGRGRLFRQVMLASASVPGIFPPQYIGVEADGRTWDEMHVDGGVRVQVFLPMTLLEPGIATREAGFAEDQARWKVYVLRNGSLARSYQATEPTTFAIVGRALSTQIQSMIYGDFIRFMYAETLYGFQILEAALPDRYVRFESSEFDQGEMRRMYELGRRQGRTGRPFQPMTPDHLARYNMPGPVNADDR